MNPFEGKKVSDIVPVRQFFSSSVTKRGAIDKKYHITIFARKGTRGAYIEKLSAYTRQREFLLDKDLSYRILSIEGNEIIVEVI